MGDYEIPEEVWLLRHRDGGGFVNAIDDSGDDLLAYTSENAAKRGAEHQNEMYDLDCGPIRVK